MSRHNSLENQHHDQTAADANHPAQCARGAKLGNGILNATEATAVGVTVTDRESLVLETFAKPPRGRAMGSWKQCPLTLRPPRFPKSPLIEINPIQRCQRFHSLQVFKPPDFQAATPRIQSDSIINYLYSLRAYYHFLETLQTITYSVTSLNKFVAATGRGGVDDSPDHAQAPGSGPVALVT